MHIYLYPRGIFDRVELWKTLMQSHMWQWTRKALKDDPAKKLKAGEDFVTLVQGSLRPTIWGAYEYIIPEDCLAEALAVMGIIDEQKSWKLPIMRKFFNCKAIPKHIWDEAKKIQTGWIVKTTKRGLTHCKIQGVGVEIVGIKEDHKAEWEVFNVEQEML